MKQWMLLVPVVLVLFVAGARADEPFVRGDVNNDGAADIVDAADILAYLFAGGATPPCDDAGDANDDGSMNIADAVFILNSFCLDGPPVPPPSPEAGEDPTADELGCAAYPVHPPIEEEGVLLSASDVTVPGGETPGGDAEVRITTDKPLAALQFTLRVDGVEDARFWIAGYRKTAFDFAKRCSDGSTFGFLPSIVMASDLLIGPGEDIALFDIHVCLPAGTPAGTYPLLVEDVRLAITEDLNTHVPQILNGQISVESVVTAECDEPADPPDPPDPGSNGITYAINGPMSIEKDEEEFSVSLVLQSEQPVLSFDMALDFSDYSLVLIDVAPTFRLGTVEPAAVAVVSDPGSGSAETQSRRTGYVALHVEVGPQAEDLWQSETAYEVAQVRFRVARPHQDFLFATLRLTDVGSHGQYLNEATYVEEGEQFTEEPSELDDLMITLRGGELPVAPTVEDIDVTFRLSDAAGRPGDSGIPVNFFIESNTAMQGFAMGFTYDKDILSVDDLTSYAHIFGMEPDFVSTRIWKPADPEAPHGAGMGMVASLLCEWLYYPSPEEVVATASFSILPDAPEGAEAAITFDDTIGDPPIANTIVYSGLSISPGTEGTDVLILNRVGGRVKVMGEVSIFLRGDANNDDGVDIADAISTLEYLFRFRAPSLCPDAADANDDGAINIADPISILATLFTTESLIAEPYPTPGEDPTPKDALGPCIR